MLTRTAIYEGALEPGTDEDGFFAAVREKLEPVWRTYHEVLDVRVHRVRDSDPGAVPVVMILEMDFADRASLDRSLASDIKGAVTRADAGGAEAVQGPLLPPCRGSAFCAGLSSRERTDHFRADNQRQADFSQASVSSTASWFTPGVSNWTTAPIAKPIVLAHIEATTYLLGWRIQVPE